MKKGRKKEKLAFGLPVGATVFVHVHVNDDPTHLPRRRWSEAKVIRINPVDHDVSVVQGPDGRTAYFGLRSMWVSTGKSWKRTDKAATHLNAAGLWWWNQDGASERVASTLEVALYADGIVIAKGWTLATPEDEEIPLTKPESVWRAPIDFCAFEEERRESVITVRAIEHAKKLAHARAMQANASRKRKRWTTSEKTWARTVARLERSKP